MILRQISRKVAWFKLSAIPLVLIILGTVGFMVFEELPFFDALYLTVITLTTVGFGDIYPHTAAGRVFTMVFVLFGVFLLFYVATTVITAVVSGDLGEVLGIQRMSHRLVEMKNHMIICGFGRMGRLVAQEFHDQKVPYVVIDKDPAVLERFNDVNGIALHGDCSSDDVLRLAGVDRAKGLVAVVSSDADNLYVTMSARLLNDKLFIIARAESELSEQKLLRAGANRAISPYRIGGNRIAQAIMRPTVVDFIELATRTSHLELQMEEASIHPGSPLIGKDLKSSNLRHELGLIIVAIKKPSGKMVFNPPSDTLIEEMDILIVLGDRAKLSQLLTLTQGPMTSQSLFRD